jgi:hypothetical protein|tara:strand:+ start:14352 stop:14642 length:291 start_codon:yes stop_codon:yes gene_type:complete
MTFSEYYQYYLTLHQNKWCRRLHVLGQCVTLIYIITVFVTKLWLLLVFAPFVVYPFAWSGHYFFEKNKPAAFSRPLWAKACDWVMLKDILFGRIEW